MQDLGSSSPGDNGTVDGCVHAEFDAVKTKDDCSTSPLLECTPETCEIDAVKTESCPSSSTLLEHTPVETRDADKPAGRGVPDHPTAGRWCKKCRAFLPLEEFPKGKRRFVCKKHAARPNNNATAARARMLDANPRKKALWRLWHYAYLDSRSAFCSAGSPTQTDIAALCDAVGLEPTMELRVVPVDPLGPAKPGNIALVRRVHRPLLVNVWKGSRDPGIYRMTLLKAVGAGLDDANHSENAP